MKRGFCILLVAAMLLCAFPALGEGSSEALYLPKDEVLVDGQVVFNDAAVQQAIESNIMYIFFGADGIKRISSLDMTDQSTPPVDLSVLQLCTGLEELQIDAGRLKSLEPLTLCKNLKALKIVNASGLDLEPLTRMKKLGTVWLSGCDSLDLTTLSSCASVTALQLEKTAVEDLSFLSGMKKLDKLIIAPVEGDASSIAPIAECNKLTSLTLMDNTQSLEVLSAMTKLKELFISGGTMEGFEELLSANAKTLQLVLLQKTGTLNESQSTSIGGLGKLKELTLSSLDGITLAGVEGLKALETITISNCGGEVDITPFGQLAKLKELRVSKAQKLVMGDMSGAKQLATVELEEIEDTGDLSALGQMKKLSQLNLVRLHNAQFDGIETMPALKEVMLRLVDAQDLSFVARAPKLQSLIMLGCRPNSHAFLNELSCAKTLSMLLLAEETLTDIDFVQNLPKLSDFMLMDTQVTSIAPLAQASKLSEVFLLGNPIEDYSALKELKKLKLLTLSQSLDDVIITDIEQAYKNLHVTRESGEGYLDIPYEAAVFYGDENAVERKDRTPPETAASEKAVRAIYAEQQRERAAELEALMEKTKPLDVELMNYWMSSDGVEVYGIYSTDEVIRIPDEIDGMPVTSIGVLSTDSYGTLKTLILPASVTQIDTSRLSNYHSNLASVVVDPRNKTFCSVDGVVFSKDMKTLVYCPASINNGQYYDIPEGVEKVEAGAFSYSNLAVSIPKSVTEFVMYSDTNDAVNTFGSVTVDEENPAFAAKDGMLTDKAGETLYICTAAAQQIAGDYSSALVEIPEGITTVGRNAFARAPFDTYTQLSIPASLVQLQDGATWGAEFMEWWLLREITVSPENPVYASLDGCLVSKDQKTLYYMLAKEDSEEPAIVPEGVEVVENKALIMHKYVQLPASVKEFGFDTGDIYTQFAKIEVDPANQVYASIDGVLFSADKKTLLLMPASYAAEEYTVPVGTEIIAEGAFDRAYTIKRLVLSDTVRECYSIPYGATIVIPDTVTKLADDLFLESLGANTWSAFRGTIVTPEGSAADELLQGLRKEYPELMDEAIVERP